MSHESTVYYEILDATHPLQWFPVPTVNAHARELMKANGHVFRKVTVTYAYEDA